MQLNGSVIEILWRTQGCDRHLLTSFQSRQSSPYVELGHFANQDVADQKDARAKKRPASGVTVIDVPNTADTCSEVMTWSMGPDTAI